KMDEIVYLISLKVFKKKGLDFSGKRVITKYMLIEGRLLEIFRKNLLQNFEKYPLTFKKILINFVI
ncbi:MAG: hypothetical protein QW607_10750, partial [Desulfurococcaceae archaeon]